MTEAAITQPSSIDHMDEFGLSPQMQKLIRDTREVVPNVMEYVKTTGAQAEKINIFMADLEEREILRKEFNGNAGAFYQFFYV